MNVKTINLLFDTLYYFKAVLKEDEQICEELIARSNTVYDNPLTEQKKLLCLAMYLHDKGNYDLSYRYAEEAMKQILPTRPFYGKILHIQTNLVYVRCYSFLHYDYQPTIQLLEDTLKLSKANKNFAIKDILLGLIDTGVVLRDYDKIYTFLESLNIFDCRHVSSDVKFCYYYGMARINEAYNDINESIRYYQLCLPFAERKEEIYCFMACQYRQKKQYEESLSYAQKSIKHCQQKNNQEILLEAQTELLLAKANLKTFDSEFWKLLNKILLPLNRDHVVSFSIIEILLLITDYYAEVGDYDSAAKYCKEGIEVITHSKRNHKTLLTFKKNLIKISLLKNNSSSELVADFELLFNDITEHYKNVIEKYKNEQYVEFQTKQKEQEITRLKELDEFKKRFYTNITHDIRTPISLILAPLETSISHAADAKEKQNLITAYQNAKKLEFFLDQLLDLNKIEEGILKPKYVYGNIKDYCLRIVETFQHKSKIAFTGTISPARQRCYFDADAMGKIMHNLISNAIKFSAQSSGIDVYLNYKDNHLELSVKDQGIGISEDQMEKIFDRFYQIDSADTKLYQGSGIGLSIVKQYAHLLGGKITVKSELGVGTTFTVIVPYKNKIEADDLVSSDNIADKIPVPHLPLPSSSASKKTTVKEYDNRDTILLVEDNDELRNFLSSQLEGTYNILEAANGAEGWQKAQKFLPTLIISDIMMPVMDGIAMCIKIKNNKDTDHIPVVLLSAKTSQQAETTGYYAMADAYIKKPFSIEILNATIRSIIYNRNILRSQVMEAIRNNLLTKLNIQTNDFFIKQFYSIIETNIYNSSLNVDMIARELNINRMTLLRKVKHYTGKKTKEIIMETRLNTAKLLLDKKDSTVKNIAYSLGFVNLDNFYKAYKKRFGVTPAHKGKPLVVVP